MMEKEERIKLYKRAIDTWGEDAQIKMLFEECGELITAVAQFYRGRVSFGEVMTELADVSIMVEQIATIMNYENYESEKNYKLNRLKERLDKHDEQKHKSENKGN